MAIVAEMERILLWHLGLVAIALVASCNSSPPPAVSPSPQSSTSSANREEPPMTVSSSISSTHANVLSVDVTGEPQAYQFAVTIQSPDTGCDQYANWWEVVSEGGELLHRRILFHSHVNEQPFTRSSGPIAIETDQGVIVRAHLHPDGYGGQVLQGTVATGFTVATLPADFGADLAEQPPLPTGCSF
ncbi:MAG: hypothetical protein F6K09_32860 [Merismopedia sp. SIO2A8]|nr:hypothetical protein [Merismopedia sp. SIO2A8]